MTKFDKIRKDIIEQLNNVEYDGGDLSDIGNEIGIAIGEHISDDMGYELDDFIHGVRHGISLINDTHFKK